MCNLASRVMLMCDQPAACATVHRTAQHRRATLQMACGSTSSFCTTSIGGQLYAWGKLKVSGDNIM
jgi:hypothetical protein